LQLISKISNARLIQIRLNITICYFWLKIKLLVTVLTSSGSS